MASFNPQVRLRSRIQDLILNELESLQSDIPQPLTHVQSLQNNISQPHPQLQIFLIIPQLFVQNVKLPVRTSRKINIMHPT
jgi:hypothetical protein